MYVDILAYTCILKAKIPTTIFERRNRNIGWRNYARLFLPLFTLTLSALWMTDALMNICICQSPFEGLSPAQCFVTASVRVHVTLNIFCIFQYKKYIYIFMRVYIYIHHSIYIYIYLDLYIASTYFFKAHIHPALPLSEY